MPVARIDRTREDIRPSAFGQPHIDIGFVEFSKLFSRNRAYDKLGAEIILISYGISPIIFGMQIV